MVEANKEDINRTMIIETAWETLQVDQAIAKLDTSKKGLSSEQAAARKESFGANKLPEEKKDSALKRFLLQFNNALIYVLLAATVLTAVLQHWIDTFVILGVVIINAIIGYIQEDKAQKALEGIKSMLSPKASIIRDGKRREIAAEDLVPGDIVIISAGDRIPADIRLISSSGLEIEEASLTGESEAVRKNKEPVDPETVLGERSSMAYTGTTVQAGEGRGIVTTTGSDTELGKINTMLSETESITTPLIRKINSFGHKLSFFIVGFSILVLIYGLTIMSSPFEEVILSVIGLAVAAIPEGLPAILTITLAIGVQKMARKNAIVRRLPSVETLGSVTVICSDKTGTLTKNEMTATSVDTSDSSWEIEGIGYSPDGRLIDPEDPDKSQDSILKNKALKKLLMSAAICNDSEIVRNEKGHWTVQGTPTEGALRTLTMKAEIDISETEKVDSIPFDSKYKYKAVLSKTTDDQIIFVNGAPDKLLTMCTKQLGKNGAEDLDQQFWEKTIERRADQGRRMLGLAFRQADKNKQEITHEDVEKDLIFLGTVGIIDPPRPEAIEAVKLCQEAGIKVKMITGDHVLTARSIGAQMGIGDGETVISGAELEKMNDTQMQQAVKDCDVFARTSPEHKLRLVTAIQANGDISAMTGDGVNDAPALKKADIGIAMGIKGTEVTKDAAAMVLADDNFSSIASAVEEGRTIYDNLKKTLLFMLPTNGAEALVILTAILFGLTMPITPVQILWVNMVTAVTLGLALAFEKSESNVMSRPPLPPEAPMISRYFFVRITFVSLLIGAITMAVFMILKEQGEELARTIAVNTLVAGELFYLFNCRKVNDTVIRRDFFANKASLLVSAILISLQIGYTYLPFMNTLFDTVPITAGQWLIPLSGGVVVFIIVEIEKFISGKILGSRT